MEGTAAVVNIGEYVSIVQQLKDYMAATRVSVADISRAINYSRTTVSRYIAGKYDSNPAELEGKLQEYLRQRTGAVIEIPTPGIKTGQRPLIYESRDAQAALGVCQSCQEYRGLGIVVGRSGYGKTHALKEYAKLPRVAYIYCSEMTGGRDLVRKIEQSLGLPKRYGSIEERMEEISDFFTVNSGYLLIVDEADKLISKHTQKKMEALRYLFDMRNVGLVIAGEPMLEVKIKMYLDQMANRVDFYAKLQGLTPSEVEGYLSGMDIHPDALVELKARACNRQTGCFRLLDRTLSNISRILAESRESVITVKTIEQASSMMML